MKKIAIITSEFNSHVTYQLKDSCKKELSGYKIEEFKCPGSVELVSVAKNIINKSNYSAIILIGAIIKGDTDHYQYVSEIVVQTFSNFILTVNIPVIFGVLTTQNEELAEARANPNKMNKGKEFASAAIQMIEVFQN